MLPNKGVVFIYLCLLYLNVNVKGEECIYDDSGLCIEACPPDTFSYTPNCEMDTMSQRTCRQPIARSIGQYCDYSRCDCHAPKLWDEAAKKCVLPTQCSDQTDIKNDRI